MRIPRLSIRANTEVMTEQKKLFDPIPKPRFNKEFQHSLNELFAWRRDVRRFLDNPVDPEVIDSLIATACLAPSVGNCQPWRFVSVDKPERRNAIRANFKEANADALNDFSGEQARKYATLKLSGLDQAPVHLAVFADVTTSYGHGLGKKTMPETVIYSVVGAINTMWLAARARGIGLGWVSILKPESINATLDVPEGWLLVAYLCIGYPVEEHTDPELQRHNWQQRISTKDVTIRR
jgi:5,6-dimethylbenzimidazole synthase